MRARSWLALALAGTALAADASPLHPLDPPDRSSPRATLATLARSTGEAWRLYASGSPAFREPLRVAARCLDESQIPASVREISSMEATLLLKEVLDRLPLPPEEELPGADAVASDGLSRFTLPHTEITLEKAASGDRPGEFLFNPPQGTLENLIGGLILYADRPVRASPSRTASRCARACACGWRRPPTSCATSSPPSSG
jgi:MscS family membrane protein